MFGIFEFIVQNTFLQSVHLEWWHENHSVSKTVDKTTQVFTESHQNPYTRVD